MSILRSAAKLAFATADVFMRSPSGPRILIYHQVGAGLGRQMEVTVEDFEWQLDWLVDNREVVDLETALLRWNEPGSDRLVVLTFDDGYRDTYSTAYPLLKERGLPFTVYLATDALGGEERLTWSQVGEMAGTGLVTVGAHTHRHADLRSVGEEEVTEELQTSNGLIESRLGVRPAHFAYPWGYWSAIAHPFVRETYSSATLGAYPPRWGSFLDPHMVHRFPVQLSDGRTWFRTRLRGGLLVEESVRRRLRGYRGPSRPERLSSTQK